MPLTLEMMQKLWPHGDQHQPGLIEAIVAQAPGVFGKYGDFDKALVQAHAMAQFSEECGAGLEMIENLNYSADGLMRTWPTRFTRARAVNYAHNPQMIADTVYGGRMGNAPPPSDDGWNFRGRGLSQLTGRDNYEKIGAKLGLDLIENPDMVNDLAYVLEIGVADFVQCGCVPFAVADNCTEVTKHLNGGTIGLASRRQWLVKWKKALLS